MLVILDNGAEFMNRRRDIHLALTTCDTKVPNGGEILRRHYLERETISEIARSLRISRDRCVRSFWRALKWIRDQYPELEEYLHLHRYESMRRVHF